MKTKVKIVIGGLLVLALAISIRVAASVGCETCYYRDLFSGMDGYQASSSGNCYAQGVLCGSINECVAGYSFCQPSFCRVQITSWCSVTAPDNPNGN